MAISLDDALGIHAQALQLRARRAAVLASNLANADTPNYLSRDIDFRAVLAGVAGRGELAATAPRHLQPAGANAGEPRFRVPSQPAIDGNTVEEEAEKAAFADNAVRYQASLRFLSGRVDGLVTALRGE